MKADALTPEMESALDELYKTYEEAYSALAKHNLLMQIAEIQKNAIFRRFLLATEYSNLTKEMKVTDGKNIRFKMKKQKKDKERDKGEQ